MEPRRSTQCYPGNFGINRPAGTVLNAALFRAYRQVMGDSSKAVDWQKVEEVTLALMHLTSFKEQGVVRSWKGHDWDVLNRLHARGWIGNPISKAKSVILSDDGERLSGELFESYFGQPDDNE